MPDLSEPSCRLIVRLWNARHEISRLAGTVVIAPQGGLPDRRADAIGAVPRRARRAVAREAGLVVVTEFPATREGGDAALAAAGAVLDEMVWRYEWKPFHAGIRCGQPTSGLLSRAVDTLPHAGAINPDRTGAATAVLLRTTRVAEAAPVPSHPAHNPRPGGRRAVWLGLGREDAISTVVIPAKAGTQCDLSAPARPAASH